ncbi:hypothetical protein PALB_7050 [Pseudoalteromonas luteoviolacea B = ATCC 29581]|nr:hypothetical protein PALB_7050 [Pseudoalteromonas luteoviolacea B = ATCC 29581]
MTPTGETEVSLPPPDRKRIFLSVISSFLIHGIVFTLLMQFSLPAPLTFEARALKTYLIVERVQSKSTQRIEMQPVEVKKEQNPAPVMPNTSLKKIKAITEKPNSVHTLTNETTQQTDVSALSATSVLEALKQRQLTIPSLSISEFEQLQKQKNTPQRLTVPTEHQNPFTLPTKILSQNSLWTEYQVGEVCFKAMNGDPNQRKTDGTPNGWIAPSPCPDLALKNAYNEAMNKWLPKKSNN